MARQMFVNLPVNDLQRSTSFYEGLGWEKNPQFSDENASCIVISDTIYAMLLTPNFFSNFTKKQIADASKQVEAILALSAESRDEVDELMNKALAAGGSESRPVDDQGFMYTRSFQDSDGHIWETFYMDMDAVPHP